MLFIMYNPHYILPDVIFFNAMINAIDILPDVIAAITMKRRPVQCLVAAAGGLPEARPPCCPFAKALLRRGSWVVEITCAPVR